MFAVRRAAPCHAAARLAAVLLLGCGCSGNAEPLAEPERSTLQHEGWAAYPRLVRLAHQPDARLNGRIAASFSRLGALLYAASLGQHRPGPLMSNRIDRSDDAGASFTRLGDAACGRSAVPRASDGPGSGVWEPEFLLAADGSLACIFSDETEPCRSQVLKPTSTRDGVHWAEPVIIVAGVAGVASSDRLGMAGVRRLPGGSYGVAAPRVTMSGAGRQGRLQGGADETGRCRAPPR